jgi:5-methylcytosine-specific restriction endonuclease McrA
MEFKKKQFEHDVAFYLQVWYSRFGRVEGTGTEETYWVDNTMIMPKCEVCQARIWWGIDLRCFHHILEKRNYPELRHEPENIAILCPDCHNRYETMPDKVPYLKEKRQQLLDEWEEWLIEQRSKNKEDAESESGYEEAC